ncbi:MATE family efflux transporter [uncultured Clostridium sp.]|uniref:MATE family efflux transporter n=1 Tax=uncultured Clostridium sp. TaxID=59620 RepID=UPI0028E971B2|nr:MATE family efflux transporter [uncultured Clostridium sp.]
MNGDMTRGNTSKLLISFAVPMMLGNIFQQLYNTVDSIIVGKFVGKEALAAVGVANPIMSIVIFFIVGICMGALVLMAEFFGAEEKDKLKREISTSLIIGTVFTLVLSIVSIMLSRGILILTQTPDNIINDADAYLKVIFIGLIFSFLYNFYSSALRATGDSRTPVLFLIISAIINVILDIVFVAFFNWGVVGAAAATVLAQAISAVLCILYIYFKIPILRLTKDELVVDKVLLKATINYSWVSATQQTCLYVGKLLVQGVVNSFGTNAIAAFSAVTRVDAFALAPGGSIADAVTTYTAQNNGAGRQDRIKEGYKQGNIIIAVYCLMVTAIVFFGADLIMKFFVAESEREVILIGVDYLKTMSLFYILSSFCNVFQGLFRGVGELRVTLFATLFQISIRVILSYMLAPYLGVKSVCYAVIGGWIFMICYEGIEYRKYMNKINQVSLKG